MSSIGDLEVRLVDGNFPGEGYVQSRCPESNWSTICTSYWDLREANVVCKELGFPYAYGIQPSGNLASDIGPVVLNKALCTGNEQHLGDCRFKQNDEECLDMVTAHGPGVQCAESKY